MKELICIVCPKGCHLKVDEENGCAVTGNGCPRGAEYGKSELLHPTRLRFLVAPSAGLRSFNSMVVTPSQSHTGPRPALAARRQLTSLGVPPLGGNAITPQRRR